MRIGLLGCGTVGQAVLRVLHEHGSLIARRAGAPIEVTAALVRHPDRQRALPHPLRLVTDPSPILEDPEVQVVVEVMGGHEPARTYMLEALRRGKTVVTANKDAVASFGEELFAAAEESGVEVLYEAAVGGGIPIIRALQESLAGNRVDSIQAVINGTTNYILTRMEQAGESLEAALAEAQRLGYAEADPAADLDGLDAARKLAILATIGFGVRVRPEDVHTEGIRGVGARDIQYARRLGMTIKLLAVARDLGDGSGLDLRVHPALLPAGHPLAAVHGSMNAVLVKGDAVGEAMFYGPGAGGGPTASSVVGDIITAVRHRLLGGRSGAPYLGLLPLKRRPLGSLWSRYYLRLEVVDRPGVLARVAGVLGEEGVSANSVFQTPAGRDEAELVLVTHETTEEQMQRVAERLQGLSLVRNPVRPLRLEGDGAPAAGQWGEGSARADRAEIWG